jgi:S-adenosylmethionine decarboxylase
VRSIVRRRLGTHVLLDLWGLPDRLLDDPRRLRAALVGAARAGGATVLDARFRRFEPQGVSGVVLLAESHVALHTWPELGYAAADVFTCGNPAVGVLVAERLLAELAPRGASVRRLARGVPPARRRKP